MAKTVYVIGELNVDAILSGEDVAPEPNKEKLVNDFEITLGSSSAITACRLAQLGLQVKFISLVGKDQFGTYCVERLTELGVDTTYVHMLATEKTGVTVSLSNPTDRSLLTYMGTISKVTPDLLPEEMWQEADHIHFGSYFLQERMRDHWQELFAVAQERGITTSFDTGYDPMETWHRESIDRLLAHTDLFIPSENEIELIYGMAQWDEAPTRLSVSRGMVAVKRGSDGSSLLLPDNSWVHENAYKVQPVDTTGAGDSFNAGLIYGYLLGMSHNDMLAFANGCGALSTLTIGGTGGMIDVTMVEEFIGKRT